MSHPDDPHADPWGDRRLVGWYDTKSTEWFEESRHHDGHNWISDATGSQWNHESVGRTAGGRWVLHHESQWQGTMPYSEFVSDDRAHEWLLANDQDEAAERFFGTIEPERGPGRPEIGPMVNVRLTQGLISHLDAVATSDGVSRAELVRQLLAEALSSGVRG